MNDRTKSLENVSVGDVLYTQRRGDWPSGRKIPYSTYKVVRLTPTLVITQNAYGHEIRFRINDARMIGGSGYFDNAFVPNQEQRREQSRAVTVRNAQTKVDAMIGSAPRDDSNDAFWLKIAAAIALLESEENADSQDSGVAQPSEVC